MPRIFSVKKKGESLLTPLCNHSRLLILELISPVQIAVQPASTTPDSTTAHPEVFLHGSGEIRSVIPQKTTADAHSRRYKVPQIPLSEEDGVAVKLPTVDCGKITSPLASHIGPLKVRTHQDRARGIRCAGQETLRTPQKQVVADQPVHPSLFTFQKWVTADSCRGGSTTAGKIPVVSLHPSADSTEPIGTDLVGDTGHKKGSQALTDGIGTRVK